MSTSYDEALLAARRRFEQQLEMNHQARKKIMRAQEELEEEGNSFDRITYQIQEGLYNIGDEHDLDWQQFLMSESDCLHYARSLGFSALRSKQEELEEQQRALLRKDDACYETFQALKVKALKEEELAKDARKNNNL